MAIFVIQNATAPTVVMKFLLWNFETSLSYTILGSVCLGILFILFLWIPRAIRAFVQAKNVKKEIEFLQGEMKHHVEEAKKNLEKRCCQKVWQPLPAFLGGP